MNDILECVRNVLKRDFPDDKEALAFLPKQDSISMKKFEGAMSSTDTCPTTQSFHHLYKDELGVYEGYCFNHIRDVWARGVHKGLVRGRKKC